MNGKNIIIGVVYKPPKGLICSFNDFMHTILNKISCENKDGYIMGDFNIDLLKSGSSDFINNVFSNNNFPTITKPTRVSDSSASLIDNIFTNSISLFVPGILIADVSDHFPIFLRTSLNHNSADTGYFTRNDSNTNTDYFINAIQYIDWNFIYSIEDVNYAYNKFTSVFQSIYDECFALIYISNSKRRKKRHPWITNGILQSIKRKNKLYQKSLKSPTNNNSVQFRVYRNKLNHVIRISKKRYFSDKLYNCKNDVKRTWSIINGILHTKGNKSPIPDALKFGSNIINDPNQIANAFNDFFVNVGPTLASNIHSSTTAEQYLKDVNSSTLFMTPTDDGEIYKVALSCLKPNKSAGYDNIKPSILRKVIHFIVKPLSHII